MSRQSEKIQGVHVWLVLWKAYEAMAGHARKSIAGLGLGLSDFAVLEVLLHKGPLPVNTIGGKVGLTSGSISVAVDRLEERGWVERREGEDRRSRVVHLTEAGRKLIDCAFGQHAAEMELRARVLSANEREELVSLLKKLGSG